MKRHSIAATLLVLGAWSAAPLAAATYHVTTDGDDGNSGLSWEEALRELPAALGLAVAGGDEILVSNGVFTVSSELVVAQAITVRGVAGAAATEVRRTAGQGRVFKVDNAGAVVEGLTISGGSCTSTGDKRGAGVLLLDGVVRACVVSNNVESTIAGVMGAGVHVAGGVLSNTVVSANTAKDSAGHGVYVANGLVVDCVVSNNNVNPATGISLQRGYGGGVRIEAGGVVRGCLVARNGNGNAAAIAGGVHVAGGELIASIVAHNRNEGYSGARGGGIYLGAGRVENCLVVSNSCNDFTEAQGGGGGGIYMENGTVAHCTVVGNGALFSDRLASTVEDVAGGVQWEGGVVSNSIVHGNHRLGGRSKCDISGAPGFAAACFATCSPSLEDGLQGNTAAAPLFVDAAGGDFRLRPDSPCLDRAPDLGTAGDLTGAPRVQDGDGDGHAMPDMGAYESEDVNGALKVWFAVDAREAFTSHQATFAATVFGSNTNGLHYRWDFGNGVEQGFGLAQLSRSYSLGFYDVSLTVSNAANETATWNWPACIRVGAPVAYVAPGGGHISPYDTWEKAATTIPAALAAAVVTPGGATRIVISNGLYKINASSEAIYIDRGITVEGLGAIGDVIIEGVAGDDVFAAIEIDHPDAVVRRLALRKANFGAIVNRGTLQACHMYNNTGSLKRGFNSGHGAGVRMYGGRVEDCLITGNTLTLGTGSAGAGAWLSGPSLLCHSVITNNTINNVFAASGAGVRLRDNFNRSVVRNCLVAFNAAGSKTYYPSSGGGIGLNGGQVESCTVVSNCVRGAGALDGGGIAGARGSAVNTIFWGNYIVTNTPAAANDMRADARALTGYSCAPELTPGDNGNVNADPRFLHAAGGDFRLQAGSPCVNSGFNQDWMAGEVDLDARHRIRTRTVDMGAYEYRPPMGSFMLLR